MNKYSAVAAFLAGFLFFTVSSCQYSNKYQTINTDNLFSLSVPVWMKKDKELKEGAEFQYCNRYRNFYAIGEVVKKTDANTSMHEMMNDNLNVLRKSLTGALAADSTDIVSNGIKGVRVEFFGKMKTENIYFSEVLFQGNKNIYHISIWTRGENRKLHFKDDINKIISSFKEI